MGQLVEYDGMEEDHIQPPTTEEELKLTCVNCLYDLIEDDYLTCPLVQSSSESPVSLLVPPSPMSSVSPEFPPSLSLPPPLQKSANPSALLC